MHRQPLPTNLKRQLVQAATWGKVGFNVVKRPARGANSLHNGSCLKYHNTAPPCPTCSNAKSLLISLTEQDSKMGELAA